MALDIKVTIDSKKLDKRLRKITRGFKDLKEPLDDTGKDLLKFYEKDVFDSQGAKMGGKWKPLAIKTLKQRADKHGHYAKSPQVKNKMLIWTGKMKRGFKKIVTRSKLTIKNTVSYFKYNQKTRPMLGINRNVKNIVRKNFKKWINKLLRK